MQQARRPRRSAHFKRRSYVEPESESESESEFEAPPQRRSLPSRRTQHRPNYTEDTTDDHVSESSDNTPPTRKDGSQTRKSSRIQTRRVTVDVATLNLPNAKPAASFRSFKRRKVNHVNDTSQEIALKTKGTGVSPPEEVAASHGRIPKWQSLEYQILLKIMKYAAYPLLEGITDTGSMRWLLNTSELCTSFREACIGALLYSPPLSPPHRAEWCFNLLRASRRQFEPNEDDVPTRRVLSTDYRKKIKRLDVEVRQLLIKKSGVDIDEFIRLTPLLLDLRLFHVNDDINAIWAQPQYSKGKKWRYGTLFDTLDAASIRLLSFEWNGRFLADDQLFTVPIDTHKRPCLSSLRHVGCVNFNTPNRERETDKLDQARSSLLDAIHQLSDLQSLCLRSSNIIDSSFVKMLQPRLQEFSMTNCPFATSEGLRDYLARSGSQLRNLELKGNQTLDLGFMSDFRVLCPNLERLHIDLSFRDPTSYGDTDPLFDDLLPNGSPTWPTRLTSIIIGPLRSLSAEDAEGFYSSLIEAAADMPYLRTVNLKTLLKDISWRDRAKMRSKWLDLFERVFLVERNAPVTTPSATSNSTRKSNPRSKDTKGRKTNNEPASNPDPSVAPVVLLLRRKAPEDVQFTKEEGEEAEETVTSVRRQGRCETVVFELSDQRPAQEQYREQDFLDDEPSGDEEWNERNEAHVLVPRYNSRHYAW